MTFKVVRFYDLVTRQSTYPFDVIVRKGPQIVMVSEERYRPPGKIVTANFYREWSYGDDWLAVFVPGKYELELVYEQFAKRSGKSL